jgi:hypothetical protein
MGSKNSKQIQNHCTAISSQIFSTMVDVNNSCKQAVTVDQNLDITIDNSNIVKACIDKATSAADAANCASFMTSNTVIKDLQQNASLDIAADCKFDEKMTNDLISKLSNKMTQSQSNKDDGIADFMAKLATAAGGKNDTNMSNTTKIQNLVKNTFNANVVNTMLSDYRTHQNMKLTVGAAHNTYIAAVNQTARIKAVQNMVANNKVLSSAVTAVENEASQDNKNETKGVADMVQSLTDMVKGIVGWTTLIPIVIFVAILVAIVMLFRGSPKPAALPPPGPPTGTGSPGTGPPGTGPPDTGPPGTGPPGPLPPGLPPPPPYPYPYPPPPPGGYLPYR